jgi:hypothetical protein
MHRSWSLWSWDRGFESRLRHGRLSSSIYHHSLVTLSTPYSLVTETRRKMNYRELPLLCLSLEGHDVTIWSALEASRLPRIEEAVTGESGSVSIYRQPLSWGRVTVPATRSDVIKTTSLSLFVISQHFKIKARCATLLRPVAGLFPSHATALSTDLPVTSRYDVMSKEAVLRRWAAVI